MPKPARLACKCAIDDALGAVATASGPTMAGINRLTLSSARPAARAV